MLDEAETVSGTFWEISLLGLGLSSLMWDAKHLNDSLSRCDFFCLNMSLKCYKNLKCYKKAKCFLQLSNLWR